MKKLLLIGLLIFTQSLISQEFSSPDNPYYWKNKTPNLSDYWQQDVDYTISMSLDEVQDIIRGDETIVYTNNSPDTLRELFFNLYQNAFIKNSYLYNLMKENGEEVKYGKWEDMGKGNEISKIEINGTKVNGNINGTVMKVNLPKPMLPNTKISIHIVFNTYYSGGGGTARRRMKTFMDQGEKHFNGAQWYPRLSVYDRKFGWTTDQHLNREFYGDFGTYRVSLNMPANYVVEATGVLQNRKEVLPDSLRKKLDIHNYDTMKWDAKVTYKIPTKPKERKTWTFLGENVHDFAWIAGPNYRIDEKVDSATGIKAVAMVLESHSSGWKNACSYTLNVIRVYNRDIGKYAYPKMVVADCQDGMEYPMLTMDGGRDPSYRGLLAHEVGHNWFYGMVNNNETYRAMLDEGFTQFLTVWSQEALEGKYAPDGKPNLQERGEDGQLPTIRDRNAYYSYLYEAMSGNEPMIDVHSDGYHGATGHGGGYGQVYNKTATMLYNLQYVLGDSLFLNAMKNYFNEWSFRHPYIEDFRNSMIRYTKVDLNWFFDQWINTAKNIDYKVYPLKQNKNGTYKLKLKRLEDMQMPLDIQITGESGKKYNYYIPNTWFQKQTKAKVLPQWTGWDSKLQPYYETNINLPENPVKVEIDSSKRLADINELNNAGKLPVTLRYINKNYYVADRHHYQMYWSPLVWYNNFDGVKLGVHFDGNYMRYFKNLSVDFWVNTTLGKSLVRPREDLSSTYREDYKNDWVSFRIKYANQLKWLNPNAYFNIWVQHLDGVAVANFEIKKQLGEVWLTLGDKMMWLRTQDQLNYLYRPSYMWNPNRYINNSVYLSASYSSDINSHWSQSLKTTLRNSFFTNLNYSYAELENNHKITGKLFDFRLRAYGRIGVNNGSNPNEILLNAGGASTEEMLNNAFMRSATFFPYSFTPGLENGHLTTTGGNLQYKGGLNMRGYSFRTSYDNTYQNNLVNQNSGFAINSQLDFEKLFGIHINKLKPYVNMNLYVFGDIGTIGNLAQSSSIWELHGSPWISDLGAGTAITIKKFKIFNSTGPFTFRFDVPFYLSNPNIQDNGKNFAFRYLIGIDKAF